MTGIGIAGMITTTIIAVRATPKALRLINEEQTSEILTKKEIFLTTWKCYIPAGVTGVLSIACIIGGQKESLRRGAALATAYSISENALKLYKEKVVETIGEKKEQLIRDAVAKDEIQQNPVINREIIITEKGNTLCYDSISARYFKSDIDELKKIENIINHRLISDMFISLNEFYDEIGLKHSSIGNDIGWNVDKQLQLSFSAQLSEDNNPCIVLNYDVAPSYDYR